MPQDTVKLGRDDETTRVRARAALDRQDALRTSGVTRASRKAENTSVGCHAMAKSDRARALENCNDRMKAVLERSADAWESRGNMFRRFEAERERTDNGAGSTAIQQGTAQDEG